MPLPKFVFAVNRSHVIMFSLPMFYPFKLISGTRTRPTHGDEASHQLDATNIDTLLAKTEHINRRNISFLLLEATSTGSRLFPFACQPTQNPASQPIHGDHNCRFDQRLPTFNEQRR